MNKAQEPLDNIENKICSKCDHHHAIEGSLTKETLCDRKEGTCYIHNLRTLVNRATPKKPEKRYYTSAYGNHGTKKRVDIKCPRCKSVFINGVRSSMGVFEVKEKEFIKTINNQKFCMFCSQAIDWSEEDEA